MKKILLFIWVVSSIIVPVFSQSTALDNVTDTTTVLQDTGRLLLREIAIDAFEDPTNWIVRMPVDKGNAKTLRIVGAPADKQPVRIESQITNYEPSDEYVLGVRLAFYKRSPSTVSIQRKREIFLPGIVKTLSVWVSGRGRNHLLKVKVRDMQGSIRDIAIGKLNFNGWKKLEVVIPNNLSQDDPNNSTIHGLFFLGFLLETNFEDSVGKYYMYLDDVRIVSDVIDDVIKQSQDDISDGW